MPNTIAPKPLLAGFTALVGIGVLAFAVQVGGDHPQAAWQAYLINFLLFSGIAQGGLLFSIVMNTTKARWSGPLATLSESFAAFFPVSFVMFLFLFAGYEYVFPWVGQDLHGKEVWLNLPFLFTRDLAGLLVLYGLGFGYLYHALWFKLRKVVVAGGMGARLMLRWNACPPDEGRFERRRYTLGILYILAFAVIGSLLGYDLVMSMDPHWFSTLFGAYTFVQAFYVGLGAVIILAAVLHGSRRIDFRLADSQFHDIGKLFFAFCLVWADFFYVQLMVIWYGNISEETAYVIERVMTPPWQHLAWVVFGVCFVGPFLILLNKRIKTMPWVMTVICATVIVGIWLAHFLVLGPAYYPHAHVLPLQWGDLLISFGFFGTLALSVALFLNQFAAIVRTGAAEVN